MHLASLFLFLRACVFTCVSSHLCFSTTTMPKFSAEQKQLILSQYSAHDRTRSYRALARQYGISKDGRSVKRWMKRWDGTIASLRQQTGAGRPRILTLLQAHNHITQPVTAANESTPPTHSLSKSTHTHSTITQQTHITQICASIRQERVRNQGQGGHSSRDKRA